MYFEQWGFVLGGTGEGFKLVVLNWVELGVGNWTRVELSYAQY